MYSTKLLNKNVVDGNAYITIGDPFKDPAQNVFRQPKKGEVFKPFQVKIQPTNEENGNFSKTTYASSAYRESNLYIQNQPLDSRKLGFGSHDAHRRDEFSNAVRTQQYREGMVKETELYQRGTVKMADELDQLMKTRAAADPLQSSGRAMNTTYSESVPQYDIGRARVTPFDPKSTKDTYYKFDGEFDKRLGPHRPASVSIGNSAWDVTYKPPANGGKSEVKNFFDKSHLRV